MRKVNCPLCRAPLSLPIPHTAPTAAVVSCSCAACEDGFDYTIGSGLPLILARFRLALLGMPDLAAAILMLAALYGQFRLLKVFGYAPVLAIVGGLTFLYCLRWRACKDVVHTFVIVS